jgi:hypothetical protein
LRDDPIIRFCIFQSCQGNNNQSASMKKRKTNPKRKEKTRPKTKLRSKLNNRESHTHAQGPLAET